MVAPLEAALQTPKDFERFLLYADITITINDAQLEVVNTLLDIQDVLHSIKQASEQIDDLVVDGYGHLQELQDIVTRLRNLNASELTALPAPLNTPQGITNTIISVASLLFTQWLFRWQRPVYTLLKGAGIITETQSALYRVTLRHFDHQALGAFIANPTAHLAEYYRWGDTLKHYQLLKNIADILQSFIPVVEWKQAPTAIVNDLYDANNRPETIYEATIDPFMLAYHYELNQLVPTLHILAAPHPDIAQEYGLHIGVSIFDNTPDTLRLNDTWQFSIDGLDMLLEQSVGVGIYHDKIAWHGVDLPDTMTLRLSGRPESPWIIGSPEGANLSIHGVYCDVTCMKGDAPLSVKECILSIGSTGNSDRAGMRLQLLGDASNGFISTLLGNAPLHIDTDLELSYSTETGLHITGGTGFSVEQSMQRKLGFVTIKKLAVAASLNTDNQFEAQIRTSLETNFSLFNITLDDIGADVVCGDNPLAPLAPTIHFKPPGGVGFQLDCPAISGGGYMSFEPENGRYIGVGEIQMLRLALSAWAMLETAREEDDRSWSLLIGFTARFPAIPLGMGLNLHAIGGLVGIHRSVDIRALGSAVRAGTLQNVLFPENVALNAQNIMQDMQQFFPSSRGEIIVGAMASLSWGVGSMVRADIGIIVNLPSPIRIALLGRIEASLPSRDKPVIQLHMDILGAVDLGEGTCSIDASLYDSHIMNMITLQGDMALRAGWKDDPTFLLSIGGFHPKFTPPSSMPLLRRMQASLPLGDKARVDIAGYLAITSNSLQFGGRLDVWARVIGLTLEGFLEMDTIIHFNPFKFDVYAALGVSLKNQRRTLIALEIDAHIIGPSVWYIDGGVRVEILGFEKEVRVSLQVGEERESLPQTQYNVYNMVKAALGEAQHLTSDHASKMIRFRTNPSDNATISSLDTVTITQNIAPLATRWDHFNGHMIEGNQELSVVSAAITNGSTSQSLDVDTQKDWFARGNHLDMQEDAKLTAPSFEQMQGGVTLKSRAIAQSEPVVMQKRYEEILHDPSLMA